MNKEVALEDTNVPKKLQSDFNRKLWVKDLN